MRTTTITGAIKNFLLLTFGSALFCVGTTYFILPAQLNSGGVLGASQVLQYIIEDLLLIYVPENIQLAGVLNFLINIPLFILAYKSMSKAFLFRTIFCIAIQTFFFTLLTPPTVPIMHDILANGLVGGALTGAGIGIVLLAGASTGGIDILAMYFTIKYKNFSVGLFSIYVNSVLYLICSILFDLSTAIYSVIVAFICSIVVDKFHAQNIRIMAIIFTTSNELSKAIVDDMGRGVTMWNGKGAYTMEDKTILVTVISKYEISALRAIVKSHDESAFLILSQGPDVMGNYIKRMDA